MLRAAAWPSALTSKRLSLIAERDTNVDWSSSDPTPSWLYAYQIPNDMLHPRNLATYERFIISTIPSQDRQAIMANVTNPILNYIFKQTNVAAWDADLRMAIVYALGAHIAMPLHGKPDRAALLTQQANQFIIQARERAANTDVNAFETVPEWISARGYSGATPGGRYFYEYGPLIAVTNVI